MELPEYNSLNLAKKFEGAGYSRTQSEVMANTISNLANEHLLTKTEFSTRMNQIDNRIDRLEEKMDFRFKEFEEKMNFRFKDLENRMTIKLGGMMVVMLGLYTGIITGIMKIFLGQVH